MLLDGAASYANHDKNLRWAEFRPYRGGWKRSEAPGRAPPDTS